MLGAGGCVTGNAEREVRDFVILLEGILMLNADDH
jgi:hypothetical protein